MTCVIKRMCRLTFRHKAKCQRIIIATSSIFRSEKAKERGEMSAFEQSSNLDWTQREKIYHGDGRFGLSSASECQGMSGGGWRRLTGAEPALLQRGSAAPSSPGPLSLQD